MKKCLLVPNEAKDADFSVASRVCRLITSSGGEVLLQDRYAGSFADISGVVAFSCDARSCGCEYVVVIGGDGSFLDASRLAVSSDIPIIGINLGHLGYLAELDLDDLELLTLIANGKYRIKQRMLLEMTLNRKHGSAMINTLALNEIAVSHGNYSHLVNIDLERDGAEAVSYRADGLIVATPSGSTAYSLSAGGPIIDGEMDAVCVTPICPHSFFGRSILFSPSSALTLRNSCIGNEKLYVTVDGRDSFELIPGEKITVTRADRRLKMLSLTDKDFLDVLRHKMRLSD